MNEAIIFGGVPVSPFDLVIADDDGVVFMPRAAAGLLEPCLARIAAEKQWEATMTAGASTIETFKVPTAHMV